MYILYKQSSPTLYNISIDKCGITWFKRLPLWINQPICGKVQFSMYLSEEIESEEQKKCMYLPTSAPF